MLVSANNTTPKTAGVVHPPSPLPGGARGWALHAEIGAKTWGFWMRSGKERG